MSATTTSPSAAAPLEPWLAAWTIIGPVYEGAALDATRTDPGNWTGGAVGSGQLRGSKYGISAASYPNVAIVDLTFETAGAIFHRDYWIAAKCDMWPGPVAFVMSDASFNNGVGNAAMWLQLSAGLVGPDVDGFIGPQTEAAVAEAVKRLGVQAFCVEFSARRIDAVGGSRNWPIDGLGWARRYVRAPFDAMTMPIGPTTPVPTPAAAVV